MSTTDPFVTTDQTDYAPGETATITATDFGIGDELQFSITVIDPTTHNVLWSGPTWDTVEGSNGLAVTWFYVTSAYAGATIELTATDLVTGQTASDIFTDTITRPPNPAGLFAIDMTNADTTLPGQPTPGGLLNGAIWANVGSDIDLDSRIGNSTGTGAWDVFSQLQGGSHDNPSGSEQGYNVRGVLDEKNDPTHVHDLVLAQLQPVDNSGNDNSNGGFFAFRLDINQSSTGGNPYLSLDELQIWQSATSHNGSFTEPSNPDGFALTGGTKVFDLDTDPVHGDSVVLLNSSLNSGSGSGVTDGQGDLVVLVPVSDFNPANGGFIYLFSAFGYDGSAWQGNGGFEEWAARTQTFTPAPDWVVSKTVGTVTYPNPIIGDTEPQSGDSDLTTATDNATNTVTVNGVTSNGLNASTHQVNVVEHNGDVVTFQITLENDGNETIQGITLTDPLLLASGAHGTLQLTTESGESSDDLSSHTITVNPTSHVMSIGGTLDVGETWIFNGSYTVSQADINNDGNDPANHPGLIYNQVTLAGSAVNPIDGSTIAVAGSASATVGLEQEPNWAVTKTITSIDYSGATAGDHDAADAAAFAADGAGDVIHYQVVIHNTGNEDLTNVTVADPLATLTGFTETGDGANTDDTMANFSGHTLHVGETWTLSYAYTVTQANINLGGVGYTLDANGNITAASVLGNPDPGFVQNTVTAHSDQLGPTSSTVDSPIEQEPGINIEKLVSVDGGTTWYLQLDDNGSESAADIARVTGALPAGDTLVSDGTVPETVVGDDVQYAVVISNTGNVTDTNIQVVDAPSSVTFSLTTAQSTLAPGTSEFVAADQTVTASADNTSDTATVSYHQGSSDSDTASFLAFDWKVDKFITVSAPAQAGDTGPLTDDHDQGFTATGNAIDSSGQTVTYTVELHNDGSTGADLVGADITMTDTLLDHLLGIPELPHATADGITFSESGTADGDLAVGETWTWSYTLTAAQVQELLDSGGAYTGAPSTQFGFADANSGAWITLDASDNQNPATPLDGYLDNLAAASTTQLNQDNTPVLPTGYDSASAPVDQHPGINIEKLASVDAAANLAGAVLGKDWWVTDDTDHGNDDDVAFLLGLRDDQGNLLFTTDEAHPGKLGVLHSGTPMVTTSAQIEYMAVVTNTGNETLTGIAVTDTTQPLVGLTGNDSDPLAPGETWIDGPTAASALPVVDGDYTNVVHVVADQGVTDDDSVSYTIVIPGVTLPGLTKGFWHRWTATWDDKTGDDGTWQKQLVGTIGGDDSHNGHDINQLYGGPSAITYGNVGTETNPSSFTPQIFSYQVDWNQDGTLDLSNVVASGTSAGRINGLNNGGGDTGLLLGDVDHSGSIHANELYFDLASAQGILTASVGGDARLIVASQAIAAQLNAYNDFVYDNTAPHTGVAAGFEAGPNGLLEAAAKWLSSSGTPVAGNATTPGSLIGGQLNNTTVNDALSNLGIESIIDDAKGKDYNESSNGTFVSLNSPKLAASSHQFSDYVTVMTQNDPNNYEVDGAGHSVAIIANANGLANALQAYNNDGNGLVLSADGAEIGWGPGFADMHPNHPGVFWEILLDQHIAGISTLAHV